jgi:nucleoside phosphorylase
MPSQDDIRDQKQLLAAHRRTVARCLRKIALQGGEPYATLADQASLQEARDNIRRIKEVLRGWGVLVEDHPDDEPPEAVPLSASSPAADPVSGASQAPAKMQPSATPSHTIAAVPGANDSSNPLPVDFVIVTALEEEREALLDKLCPYKRVNPSPDDILHYYMSDIPVTFPDESTGTYRVIVMQLLGMGRVKGANAISAAIHHWKPRYVILVGIAGGIAAAGVKLGDVLVSSQIVDYGLQKQTRAKRPQERWEVHPVDQRLLGAAQNLLDKKWQESVTAERPEPGTPKRHIGPILSGDKVIAFGEVVQQHLATWPKLIGVEMEAGGVVAAAFEAATHPGFFMVRGVSDFADEQKDSDLVVKWRTYACDVAVSYTMTLLKSGFISPCIPRKDILYTQAQHAEAVHDWDRAIELYERIMAIDPHYKDTEKRLVVAQRQQRLHLLNSEAKEAEARGDWSRVIAVCQAIIDINPDYRDTRWLLWRARFQSAKRIIIDRFTILWQACLDRAKWILIGRWAISMIAVVLIVSSGPPPLNIDAFTITRGDGQLEAVKPGMTVSAIPGEIFRVRVGVSTTSQAQESLFRFTWYTCRQGYKPAAQNAANIAAPPNTPYVTPREPGLDCVQVVVSQGNRMLDEDRIFINIE